jgi:hypothetical protein
MLLVEHGKTLEGLGAEDIVVAHGHLKVDWVQIQKHARDLGSGLLTHLLGCVAVDEAAHEISSSPLVALDIALTIHDALDSIAELLRG